MRVLVFTDEFDYSHYTFIYNEIKKLQEAGLDVHVVCERVGKLRSEDTNYTCVPVPTGKLFGTGYWWFNNKGFYRILSVYPFFHKRKKIIKNFKPDLVHMHFGPTAVRLFPVLEETLKEYPVLIGFHGFDASSMLRNEQYVDRLGKILRREGIYSIYVSNALRNNLVASRVGINNQNSFLLYYGIDISMFRRSQRQNNPVRKFLQISNFNEKKGHIYTLRAFKQFLVKNPGKARLILGGDGPLKEAVVKECQELGLNDAVDFPGWISREVAVRLFNEADCFVHHSITGDNGDQEGLPNSILEAMAMELPVLATWHSGIPEVVTDGVNGLLVKEKDIDTYALQMEQVLKWSYLPGNRKKIEDIFSLEAHTRNLLNIYEKTHKKQAIHERPFRKALL